MRVIGKIKIGVIGAVLIFLACVEHNQKEKTYNAKLEVENIKGLEYKRFGIKGTTVSGQLPRGGNIFLRSELGMGGWDGAIDHQNNIAYIASGFGLRTFDVSDPANIKFLGVIGLPDFCRDVDVSGGIAFVVCGTAGLRIIDVSNPEYPREITFYDTPGYAWGVYRVGTIVYIADGPSGLRIIDVSNPYNPQLLGWLDTPGYAVDVFVKDNKAYVADRWGGMRIIDVSNPTDPQEIGAFAPAGSKDFWDVYVVGNKAYVADGYPSGLSPALRIIDVSNPANPTQISSITLFGDRTGWSRINWLSYKGNYIFYSNSWAWGGTNPPRGGVRVIDVSNPSSPFICAEIYEPWTETHGVFVNPTTNLLYLVWDWQRFATFDISNPCNPVLLNIWRSPGDSWGVALDPSRKIAYIGDGGGGLRIIDISDISFPREISYWDTPCYARGVDVKTHPSGATIAYVADACGGLRIIDVTNPQYPQEASFFRPWGVESFTNYWRYRRAITISNIGNPNPLTDYQVLVTNPIYNETGLVASWHFNEGSGTVAYDSSGNNNNGTLYNGPTWVDGKFGKALSFDGVNDYVLSSRGIAPPSTFTANIWIYYTGDNGVVVDWLGQAGINTGYHASGIEIVGGTVRIRYWSLPCVNLGSITPNNWYMITLVYDGSNLKGYINGEFRASTSGALTHPSTLYIALGATDTTHCGDGTYFGGIVDEFRFYNRALSDAEIQALYQAKARLDYGDIRFTDSDGSTLLNYWQEADGRFWVKVPYIPANSTKTIYVYYGNPSATSLSNGDATFDFFDDFEGTSLDTTKWVAYANSYSVSNSVLRVNIGGIERTSAFPFNIQDGYMVETKVIHYTSAGGYGGVLPEVASSPFTASGNANANATILYMRQVGSATVYYWIGNGASASYNVANGASTGWTSSNNVWYITGISVRGGEVKLWRDGTAIVTVTGITWYKNLKYVKLGSFHRNAAYDIQDTGYDWIRVRKYTSPEPTA
ncbi:MAG: DUF2341 domain-containing protein, partial [Candidatus Calescibacterium sp.]